MRPPQFTIRLLLGLCVVVALIFGVGRIAFLTAYRAYIENFTTYVLDGPPSPDGYRVSVDVHDNSPGISTCFLADVYVRDSWGRPLASWFDPDGQCSAQGVRELVASMRWEDKRTLVFYTVDSQLKDAPRQKVVLHLSGNATPLAKRGGCETQTGAAGVFDDGKESHD
jgi:hypothetical protein